MEVKLNKLISKANAFTFKYSVFSMSIYYVLSRGECSDGISEWTRIDVPAACNQDQPICGQPQAREILEADGIEIE